MKSNSKELIQASFRRLLFAKSLDKITVRDIVEDCGLTRNTFYYYYEDIYDLFDDYLDVQGRKVWGSLPPGCSWDHILLTVVGNIFDSPQTARHIMNSKKNDMMRLYLNRMLRALVDQYIDRSCGDLNTGADDRRMICEAVSHAIYGLLDQWISGPDAPLMHSHLERLARCFSGAIRHALEYCAANPIREERV